MRRHTKHYDESARKVSYRFRISVDEGKQKAGQLPRLRMRESPCALPRTTI